MKASELRNRTPGELSTELNALLREQFNLRMRQGIGQLTRPDQMKKVRRDIARIKTILQEKISAGNVV